MSKTKEYTKDQVMIEVMQNLVLGQWVKIKNWGMKSKFTGKSIFSSVSLKYLQKNGFIKCAVIKGSDTIPGDTQGEIPCILQETNPTYCRYILKVREYISPEMEKKILVRDLLKIIPSDKLTESLKERLDKFSKT